jgi:formamidopyrimidine-DNA glycosylase
VPELPEVETIVKGLRRELTGDVISHAVVLRDASIGHPSTRDFARLLPGHKIERVTRRGKYMIIELSNKASLVVHLKMSGRLLLKKQKSKPDRFLRVSLKLESGRELHFEDMRVFGRLWFFTSKQNPNENIKGLKTMGVEPLEDLTFEYLKAKLQKKTAPIKNVIMDQTIIAGVGNIYADESLFMAGVKPARQAGSLKDKEIKTLIESIIKVLRAAIKAGGSSMKDYTDLDGVNGNYMSESWVYRRTSEKCRKCKSEIERIKIGGRSTHFCPRCQK